MTVTWNPRDTAPSYSSTPNPYYWPSGAQGECTWYAYYRALEGYGDWYVTSNNDIIGYYPCWRTGSGSSGSQGFSDAKNWLSHYRDPWVVKSTSATLYPGDIIIFTGTAGHCAVIEDTSGSGYIVTDYNLSGYHTFGKRYWDGSSIMSTGYASTGAYIGALHRSDSVPPSPPTPPTPPTPPATPIIMLPMGRKRKFKIKL